METIFHDAVHVLLALGLPPLLLGLIAKTKALFAGRVGPSVLQPYYDLIKLVQKGSVFSTTTTWVFRAGPVVALVTAGIAVLLIPLADATAPLSFTGDFVLLAYLLGLGRFFTASAALDTGSPFEGMGAAREVTFACLAEPAFFLGMLVLAKLSGSLQLADMLGSSLASHWSADGESLVLVLLSWFIILLAENSRIPFDDPNTHLELTMIHEVMVLDHSGPDLAYIHYGAALKLWILGGLLVGLAVPVRSGNIWLDGAAMLLGMALLAGAIGMIESAMARYRLNHVPQFIVGAATLSAVAFILILA